MVFFNANGKEGLWTPPCFHPVVFCIKVYSLSQLTASLEDRFRITFLDSSNLFSFPFFTPANTIRVPSFSFSGVRAKMDESPKLKAVCVALRLSFPSRSV